MLNPRLAARYAKSIIDLAVEQKQLEEVHNDMQFLQAVAKSSREFVNVLQSPVIPAEKKGKIFDEVTKGKVCQLTSAFLKLLVTKNREFFLVEIIRAVIDQYNTIKGIHRVKLTTAIPIGEDVKQAIISKIKNNSTIQNIQLETVVKEELIGGFVLEFDNNLIDASIARDLRDVKKQFDKNMYVQQLR